MVCAVKRPLASGSGLRYAAAMQTHMQIDRRSLRLAEVIAARIDADPARRGLEAARKTCTHWMRVAPSPAVAEWARILERPWEDVRVALLEPGEDGCRRRQNSPFCSVLTPRERWDFYRSFARESSAA